MQQLISKSSLGASLVHEPACVLGPSLSLLRLPAAMSCEPSLYAGVVERNTRGRVLSMEMLQREPAQLRRYDASQFGLLTAYVYPKGTWERLEVCNDWHVWLFLFDDQVDELAEVGQRPEYLKAYVDACVAVLRGGALRAGATPLERFTYDLRLRMSRLASEMWMERFVTDVEDYIYRGTLLAARHWTDGTVPDLDSYIEQRAMDSAVYTAEDLVEFAEPDQELPEELFRLPLVQRLRQLCTRVVALSNDLFSFEKEVLWHHNPNNFVHLLRVHH
ncbi:MAG: terpene synthase family protein, partial [Cystobacter sp.]